MSSLSAGVVGVRQAGSTSESPVYDTPFGTVQLASSSKDGSGNYDLAAGFSAPADFENQDEEDDEEGDEDDGDSEDGKAKGKKGKRSRSEAKGERDLKTGRRKIKIEFIDDDARRHITFSKRKAGIMKKAYELATLTGTQVLLLVVSQTGLVYTFTTPKLQALVTQAEGRNLIQACLNAPDPSGGDGSGQEESGEEGSEADDGLSPSESQASSNKRAAQARKRPRNDSASKSSSASTSALGLSGLAEEDGASGSQLATAKRGRGRPRKITTGGTASYNDAAAMPGSAGSSTNHGGAGDASHPMPPPPMHQSYSDDAVHQHQQHQQQHQPQYTHVPSAEFAGYGTGGFYGDATSAAGAHNLGFAQQGALGVDANQAAWNQTMSPSTNTQSMFPDPNHHQQQQQHLHQQQHQQQSQQQFNYNAAAAAQHFGHFNPQQLQSMQPQEIQAPRPAW